MQYFLYFKICIEFETNSGQLVQEWVPVLRKFKRLQNAKNFINKRLSFTKPLCVESNRLECFKNFRIFRFKGKIQQWKIENKKDRKLISIFKGVDCA